MEAPAETVNDSEIDELIIFTNNPMVKTMVPSQYRTFLDDMSRCLIELKAWRQNYKNG
jgi:hypothetical protein